MAVILYVASWAWFASSMANPYHPYMEYIVPCLALSTIWFGFVVYRRLYGKRGRHLHRI